MQDALSLLVATASFLQAVVLRAPDPDYQKQADAAPWSCSDREGTLRECIARYLKDYAVEVTAHEPPLLKSLSIRVRKRGQEVYAWQGHRYTVLTRWQDTLS